MWFSNIFFYKLTKPFDLDQETLEARLQDFAFTPCGNLDVTKTGWVPALGKHSQLFSHYSDGNVLLCLKKEEKIIPASVINEMLEEKVQEIEAKESRPVKRAEKTTLKEEIMHTLLPRAFTRSSRLMGYIDTKNSMVVVNVASASKAEDFLAILRKSLGSLPVVPVVGESTPEMFMTQWLKSNELPEGFGLTQEAEMKALEEEGAIAKFKQQDLQSEEVLAQLEHGKYVVQLGMQWHENVSFVLTEDLALKRIKYADVLKEQNEDIPKEELMAKLDADFALVSGELNLLIADICKVIGFEAA